MPVWHEKTKELVASGRLAIVGITQEQHPDRCALYAQWQGFDFPILWDPFGLTGLSVVPVITGINELGVVDLVRPHPRKFQKQFLDWFKGPVPDGVPAGRSGFLVGRPELGSFVPSEESKGLVHVNDARRAISRLVLGGPSTPTIDSDVGTLEAWAKRTGRAKDRFHAGVARRLRYDGPSARAEDFQVAADAWHAALAADPNQYIWRRRIQQWGPRLDKPYAFYDWVPKAIEQIRGRGEAPRRLAVPLSGSEVANKNQAVPAPVGEAAEPDPKGLLARDSGGLVQVETATLLHTGIAGRKMRTPPGSSQVHVTLRPRGGAKWSNDTEPPVLWLPVPKGWVAARSLHTFPGPTAGDGALTAPLRVDFEVSTPTIPLGPPKEGAPPALDSTLSGYVTYSICLPDGTCVFRRQDVEVTIPLPEPPSFGDD